jgi:putative chitinase
MILRNGSKGPSVKQIQEKLGVEPTGNFGPKTEAAVKAWQKANGLKDDGIVGPNTLTRMGISVAAPAAPSAPASAPVSIPPSSFKLEKLKGHIPDAVIAQIPDTAAKFNITNTLRLAHFLAQCGHESGGFRAVQENLNYSADGLNKIFPKYFRNAGRDANAFARNPEKIANVVYANRMANGDPASGDGWRFRGRGYIQLTGRGNYTKFDKMVTENILEQPDLVASKYPLMSAAFFFDSNGLWSICDRGADDATITAVTKRVNGGTIGLADRIKHFKEYYNLLK